MATWIGACLTIEDPHGADVSIVPFDLWPAQSETLRVLRESAQLIVLKARQLGMSWLVLAYALWLCLYHANQLVMVFSKDQDSANEMVRRVTGMYQRLAHKPVGLVTANVGNIAWSNGSRVKSFAATEDAGSSFTASLTILDEFAKMRYADALYTSVKPTISDGGRIVIISTARGEGNTFHKLWKAAQAGLNSFKAVFLPWSVRPGRDAAWYAATAADAVSAAHHRQEYPATAEEAFIYVGEDRFLPTMQLWDACAEQLPPLGKTEPCVVALDAGTKDDHFGFVVVTRHPQRHADVAIRWAREWKPVGGIINFQGTEDDPGPELVLRKMCERVPDPADPAAPWRQRYNVVCVTYDPSQLVDMANRLTADGVAWMREFNQGQDRLEADKQLYDLVVQRHLAHTGDPVLRASVENANQKPDPESNKLRIVKREHALKIDILVAASMASNICLKLDI